MKTLGRILIILAIFAAVMGITYLIVNAGGTSTAANMPAFERGERGSMPDGERAQFADGQRPEFRDDEMREFGDGQGGGRWIFGMIKNVGIIAVITALIVIPKSIRQRRNRNLPASA
ncbi:MAG: hypothetical protein ACM33V_01320 [Chloroflexota bacterium]|nr:hypothetical protein [Anaerolineales bacterium]